LRGRPTLDVRRRPIDGFVGKFDAGRLCHHNGGGPSEVAPRRRHGRRSSDDWRHVWPPPGNPATTERAGNQSRHPTQQHGRIGLPWLATTGRRGIVRRHLVDDGQPRFEADATDDVPRRHGKSHTDGSGLRVGKWGAVGAAVAVITQPRQAVIGAPRDGDQLVSFERCLLARQRSRIAAQVKLI